jgi:hypothetical protein
MQNKKNITSSSKLDDKHKHTTPNRIRYFQDTHTHTQGHRDRDRDREQFFESAPVKNSGRNLTAYAIFDRSTECMLIGSLSAQDVCVCVCVCVSVVCLCSCLWCRACRVSSRVSSRTEEDTHTEKER